MQHNKYFMSCKFQSLYYGDAGYVVKCNKCGCYQVAYISTLLNLTRHNFQALCSLVQCKCGEADYIMAGNTKTVVLQTSADGICLLLTRQELLGLHKILQEADNEEKALTLISLFNRQ